MEKYEIVPGEKSPKNLKLTGRDGPPGSHMQIRGAPVWLEEDGRPKSEVGSQQLSARGKPHTEPVISTRYEERSATAKLKSNRFLHRGLGVGMTRGCRGKPLQERIILFIGQNALNREKFDLSGAIGNKTLCNLYACKLILIWN